ncbi:MAG TPA: PKD domain-containing protein [Solirubrobacterales bacterium]|nr:PKD domain-containing protein [Solirubrobacterales bacterium]
MTSRSVSVRGLAAIAAVCALACLGAASAGAAQLAVVATEEGHSVSIVNTATNQVVGRPIEVGKGAASVAVTPNGRYAYVADALGESVSVVDIAARRNVATIEVGNTPFGLAISPDGSHVYVTDRGSEEVSVIDTQTRQVVRAIDIPPISRPTGVAISPDGKRAYVTEAGADSVQAIDVASMETLGKPIEVGESPAGVEFTPDGKTAYVVDQGGDEVSAIDTATRKVTSIPLNGGEEPRGIVVSPDGRKAFVVNLLSDSVSVIDTATNKAIKEIPVGAGPQEVGITATGKTVYVTERGRGPTLTPQVQRIDVETGAVVGSPIAIPGEFPSGIALTPDQSPTAVFTPPTATVGIPAAFDGAGSTDPDGAIASWKWAFGDGWIAEGANVSHTYSGPGTYNAELSVVDDEGCGERQVFTGRTAYCSGNPLAKAVHPVEVKAPMPPPPACSAKFHFGGLIHKRKNGTARLQVKLPAAGSVFLFGKKVHAVRRKIKKAGSLWLTIHARVELNKRLKKIHRARVRVRVTFTPNAGCGSKTMHRSFALLRARKHRHHHHR